MSEETQTQTMVERVARAIAEELTTQGSSLAFSSSIHFGFIAKAAIKAMRDPTAWMISEGESLATMGIGRAEDDEALPRVWRGMIDVALKEK